MQDQYTNPHAQPDGQDVDALLQDVRSILGESDDAIAGQADQLQPDDAAQEQMPEPEQEDAQPRTPAAGICSTAMTMRRRRRGRGRR